MNLCLVLRSFSGFVPSFCAASPAAATSSAKEVQNALELFGIVPQKSILDAAMLSAWDACSEHGLFR